MLRRKPHTLLVCLLFLITVFAADALGYSIKQASAVNCPEDYFAPTMPRYKAITKVKPHPILKVRPFGEAWSGTTSGKLGRALCCLPRPKTKGWELSAEVIFARTKGKIRYNRGQYWGGYYGNASPDLDLNSNLGIPDHNAVASMTVAYRFRPHWSVRYSLMPMEVTGTGGNMLNQAYYSQGLNVKWQRLYHRVGLLYDPVRTYRARISLFGDYVRVDEKISGIWGTCVTCPGGGGDTYDHALNMAMAGLEFERCLKAGRWGNYLSCDCKAGIAFLDKAFGSDITAGLKCTIPMGKGRWGYIGGGYRFITFKKGYSEVEQIDTAIEGGFLKMGITLVKKATIIRGLRNGRSSRGGEQPGS
ncbi:MAG: hypothetical protein P8182_11565 [Deltaproteobacteria bacterium]